MINNSKKGVAEFEYFERIFNHDDRKMIQDFIKNPNSQENKLKITDFFEKMNVEINVDDLANAIAQH